ncbi:zinc-binding alcohol dehydrogenase family protein [Limosilactobacillus coleohominis]|uniref:Zinc-binding dehydrogenase n=1 Tax=Limosilactobacillus coleohominis TaxID=181675 RepID=A0ABS2GUS3_9LACO|nr:zinc-binding alcohol dehydrogenase family protein [Limosilactobacillus coleohominis]MBM6940000.1 zinc-binding dehydrogenase [Limosilactobacillus coleohominis]
MKAIVISEAGGPEKLQYTDVPTPQVKPGWSLVQVKGFGINHSEIFTRKGLSPDVQFPRILGIECVGIITQTTDDARLPVGQKVISIMGEMGRQFDGSYAEYVLLPNEQIYPVTSNLDWATLATLPETYYTAYGSLLNLRIQSGNKVLVRGGTSGVGTAFVNLVKAKDPQIHIAGTTRSYDKKQLLIQSGYDEVILDQDGKLQSTEEFDRVLELIGPATIQDTFQHVHEGGIVCSTGQLGNQWYLEHFDPIMDIAANGYLTSFYSGNVNQQKIDDLLRYVEQYDVQVKPEKIYSLSEVPEAHRYLASHNSLGKVIVLNR